ncbi:hypothetical protein [Serratia sp. NPDC087055]|uniref:hypothetical protein n=1 Tax=Serratia sp. NPDC087055 TaxID=3364516 RepID=UPI00384CD044
MSAAANWSYTAVATVWRKDGPADEYGKQKWLPPITIMCDYGGDATTRLGDIGIEFVVKNTHWTEYALAEQGDYILIGSSAALDPTKVDGADEVRHIIRYADTFDRIADDYAIITGV